MANFAPTNLGGVTSTVEYSESVRPAGKYRVAPWLPVKRYDGRANEYLVMMSGIPVKAARPIDADGLAAGFTDLFPAHLIETSTVTYTQTDVDLGILSAATGLPLTTADIGAVNLADTIGNSAAGAFNTATCSFPVGILACNGWRFPGGDGVNANGFNITNKSFQNQVPLVLDYVIEVPVQVGTYETITDTSAAAGVTQTLTYVLAPALVGAGGSALTDFVVTVNGVVDTGATAVDAAPDITVTLSSAAVITDTVSIRFMTATASAGLQTGMPLYVTASTDTLPTIGSFVKAGAAEGRYAAWIPGTDSPAHIIGQIISADNTLNRGALNKVRTHYVNGSLYTNHLGTNTALYSMAGSATGGRSGNLYRATGTDFQLGVVRINLLK